MGLPQELRTVAGIRVEWLERGEGRPILFLHPGIGIAPDAPVLDLLAAKARVIAPAHPGFGRSEQPTDFTTIDDLAYFYLELMDALRLEDALLVGVSFGGWLAAEIAIKSCARIAHVVLADALGIKVGARDERDIADIFAMSEADFLARAYANPEAAKRDYKSMAEAEVVPIARNREALARYGWQPYMHDPKLRQRLRRIRVPSLVLWGEADRIVSPDYGRAYAAALASARFATIAGAGHFPHIEKPAEFAAKILAFRETAP
jgi:pimeloyl-ACP methyl ester carboxylesterase